MNLFDKNLILLSLDCSTKNEVIEIIGKLLYENQRLKSDNNYTQEELIKEIIKSFHDREILDPTYVGFNFAIPHGKSAVVKYPTVVFIKLKTPILWGEEEDELASMLYGIAVPNDTNDLHLKILADLSCSILDEDFVQQLEQCENKDDVLKMLQNISKYSFV